MELELAKLIGHVGAEMPFSETFDFREMEFGGSRPVQEPVEANGTVRNEAGVLLLSGTVETKLHCVCDRCAKPFERDVRIDLHAVLETDPDSAEPEDVWTFPVKDDRADLEEIVRTAFVFEMDGQLLCREDCKGLCCRCGKDLNLGPCDCKPERDPRFAVLQTLLDKQS